MSYTSPVSPGAKDSTTDPAAGLLVTGASLADLERHFVARIAELKSGNALAPVTVIVGSNLQHAYLRRLLARSLGAIANVRFRTLLDVAGDIALSGAQLPARVLPDGAQAPLLHHILLQLGADRELTVLHHELPGLADAMLATLRDLRDGQVSPETVARTLPDVRRALDIATVAKAVAEVTEQFADRTRLTELALTAEPSMVREVLGTGPMLCYGVYDVTAIQGKLLEKLARSCPLTVYLLWSESHKSLMFGGPLHQRLTHVGLPSATLPPDDRDGDGPAGRLFFSAPDRQVEAEEISRLILDDLEDGVPPGDIAVVHHLDQNQDELISSALVRAGVPHYLAAGRPVRRTPEGRGALLLLKLLCDVPTRASLLEFLSLPGIRLDWIDPGLRPRPAAWEALTKQIGMIRGWPEFEALLKAQLPGAEGEQEPERFEFERERVSQLLDIVRGFKAKANALQEAGSWSRSAAAFADLLGASLTPVTGNGQVLDTISDRLSMLGSLDLAGVPCDTASFRGAVESAIREAVTSGGYFQQAGVFVGGVVAARFLRFSRLYLLECAERVLPPVIREDPLLPDEERALINAAGDGSLPLKRRRLDEERLLFELVRQSAIGRLTISYSRKSGSGNTARLPSAFFLGAVAAAAGEEFLSIEDLERLAPPWFRRLPARLTFQANGLEGNIRALDDSDLRRHVLEEHGQQGLPAIRALWTNLERTNAARRSRGESRFGSFDGVVGPDLVRNSGVLAADLSASSLASYVACPYRFFLSKLLGLRSMEEPEENLEMGARERGTLVHHVLEDLVNEFLAEGGSWEVFLAGAAARVERIASRRVAALGPGVTGLPVIWEMVREEALADIQHYLHDELVDARDGWTPIGAEFDFNEVAVPAENGGFSVRGRIDRMDQRDDRYRVVDYKTGGVWETAYGFRQGTSLQLPLYIRAASAQQSVGEDKVQAEYHYVGRKGRFERIVLRGSELAGDQSFERVKSALRAGIEAGTFFYSPGGRNRETCKLCDFVAVCRERVAWDFERKAPGSPDLRADFNRIRREADV